VKELIVKALANGQQVKVLVATPAPLEWERLAGDHRGWPGGGAHPDDPSGLEHNGRNMTVTTIY
jgi:hypothetical protein